MIGRLNSGRDSRQRGFTLMEFMIVVALIGLLVAALAIQFDEANVQRNTTQAVADLKTIISATKMLRDPEKGYLGISANEVSAQQGFPKQLCKNGDCATGISSAAFGPVYLIAAYLNGFYITIGPVSDAQCVSICSKIIHSVDGIVVGPSISHTNPEVLRSSVLATTTTKPARDYFYPTGTGICANANNNYILLDVDYL